jgi:beta-glucoside operon transcriptional antiterminator
MHFVNAQFATHLRYLFTRIGTGRQINESHRTLVDAIANAHPEAMGCAAKLQYFFEMGLSTNLTEDETAYLALHVARLVADIRSQVAG